MEVWVRGTDSGAGLKEEQQERTSRRRSQSLLCVRVFQAYERAAIAAWLDRHTTSPLTGLPLESPLLVPCVALRQLIASFAAARPQ